MEKDKKINKFKLCEFCKANATFLCFQCKIYFCEKCFKVIHDLKKNPQHEKEKIDPYIEIDVKCPDHPEYPMDLFCIDEKGKKYSLLKK